MKLLNFAFFFILAGAVITGIIWAIYVLFFYKSSKSNIDAKKKKEQSTRERLEQKSREHLSEVKKIMDKINMYKKVILILLLPYSLGAQPMSIPALGYKDVILINKPGLVYNFADTAIVISPLRYRFYEGLIQDITALDWHYKNVILSKDSIINIVDLQLRDSDDLLNQCAVDLERCQNKKPNKFKAAGQIFVLAMTFVTGFYISKIAR